jgi:hypothetical protein
MVLSILLQLGNMIISCAMTGPISVGTDARVWEHGAVVYAEVLDTKQQDDNPSHWKLRLRPLATLTGRIDAAEKEEIEATATIRNILASYIINVPAKGTKVIALLGGVAFANDGPYSIPPGNAPMLPVNERGDRPCLFEVTGFEDPKVTETIESLRKLRGKQREESEENAENKKVEEK